MRGVIHHLDLTVVIPTRFLPFTTPSFRPSGIGLSEKVTGASIGTCNRPLGVHSIGIVKASGEGGRRPHDRYSPGLHHVAWGVDSREEVDRMYEVVQRIGAKVLDVPADYPQYNNGGGYYAVFFADPDGLKLECVYTPRPSDA
jgi:catechol 2,3-dioxygenase-like lactoylglutathione lyase family enzyme